jgi:hypothetical protein
MLYQRIFLIILLFAITTINSAYASTTIEYKSLCKYFNSKGVLKFKSTCKVNWGTLGVKCGERFILTFPNGSEVWIYSPIDGTSTANDIEAKISIEDKRILVKTKEKEIFIFNAPPEN